MVAKGVRVDDLPQVELDILRFQGVKLSRTELKRLLHSLNVCAETGLLDEHLTQREFRGAANTFREAVMVLDGEINRRRNTSSDENESRNRQSRGAVLGVSFFSGISAVVTGAAAVVGDLAYAFGPPFLVPTPHGFDETTYTSIVSGVGIAAAGVPFLNRRSQ